MSREQRERHQERVASVSLTESYFLRSSATMLVEVSTSSAESPKQ